jgi:putative two-component system response regulator
VVSIADVFDALTHVRPYKQAWTIDEALLEIERLRGRAFDPSIVDAFMTLGVDRWTTAQLDALGTAPRQFRPAA